MTTEEGYLAEMNNALREFVSIFQLYYLNVSSVITTVFITGAGLFDLR